MSAASAAFKICLVLHVLCVIVAFGPAFAYPFAARAGNHAAAAMLRVTRRLVIPAMVGMIVFGVLAVVTGNDTFGFEMSDPFVSIGFVLAFLAVAVAVAIVMPAQRRLAAAVPPGDGAGGHSPDDETLASLRGRVAGGTGALHLILLVAVIVMIWQP